MNKPEWRAEEYETEYSHLDTLAGRASDYPPSTAIEPAKPVRQTYLPAHTPLEQGQQSRQQVVGQLRQIIDQQNQEPASTPTGNRFIIHEDTNAKDRAGAGLRWWLLLLWSLLPLAFGVGLWLFWGWGFFSFFFTCLGSGVLLGVILLNWQAISQSPISIEKQQRNLDHEYRMYKEANAQRTREQIIGGFIGQAQQDLNRNLPIDGQVLLVNSKNEVNP